MRWYAIEFTHYTGDDTQFDNFDRDDYFPIEADTLSEALRQAAGTVYGSDLPMLSRIDDSDSPYGGVFTVSRYARRYHILNDWTLSNLPVFGVFAEGVMNFPALSPASVSSV